MKKIVFFSIFCSAIGFLTSCAADDVADRTFTIAADDTGGQYGIPPPPPPKPGTPMNP